jgi:hypothetical protein
MTQTEALRLALEAMKVSNSAWKSLADSGDAGFWKAEKQGYYQLNEQAIKAVEAALEAKDEPVSTGDTLFRQFMSEAEKAGVTHLIPPQRKPLTDEEIDAIVVDEVGLDADADEMHNFARAIEAAHGIKGEA